MGWGSMGWLCSVPGCPRRCDGLWSRRRVGLSGWGRRSGRRCWGRTASCPEVPASVLTCCRPVLASGGRERRRQVAQCPGSLGDTGRTSPRTGRRGSLGLAYPFWKGAQTLLLARVPMCLLWQAGWPWVSLHVGVPLCLLPSSPGVRSATAFLPWPSPSWTALGPRPSAPARRRPGPPRGPCAGGQALE